MTKLTKILMLIFKIFLGKSYDYLRKFSNT